MEQSNSPADDRRGPRDVGRRRFLGYLLAAPTLAAAAQLGGPAAADAQGLPIPQLPIPEPSDVYDLSDLLVETALPTSNLITVTMNKDGTASFELPRQESGQGITTMAAMLIAEELDLPLEKVNVTLADARPELLFNQFTAGSSTVLTTYTPIRTAAAIVKGQLLKAASLQLGEAVGTLASKLGVITSTAGAALNYGELAEVAASLTTEPIEAILKPESEFRIIGKPQNRIDSREAVTGTKQYAMDLDIPDALPTMVCRPPTIKGKVKSVRNLDAVRQMPGITDVVPIATGVAVRGRTFGQCIDAVRTIDAEWGPGSVDGMSDETVLADLRKAEIPLAVPNLPLYETVEGDFVFHFRNNAALEPNTAVADVREDSAELWAPLQSPILTKQEVAKLLGMPQEKVAVHVQQAGGAFGRRMFSDVALEAAEISQKIGKPVKLMWHRTDECRQGRTHPMCTSRIRVAHSGGAVLSFEQRHTGVSTDYTQGFGEILVNQVAKLPPLGIPNEVGLSIPIFLLTANVPYKFGVTTQLLNEIYEFDTFPTGSVRNLFNSEVVTSREIVVDEVARKLGKDPYEFRKEYLDEQRLLDVLNKAAEVGKWGRPMEPGTAQGICVHKEYKGVNATMVEIDCRPETVNRPIRDGVTGPRVTKVVTAIDTGLTINPRGLEAQMQGGIMDGIAQALTSSLHLQDGVFLEGSWDDYFYTRQWNTPPEMEIVIMPPTTGRPGGAGEFGVAASMAAVACAYARATGTVPTSFPINHGTLGFTPKSVIPPVPESPTDGLNFAF
ncbi:isoquinoline 1-oxidoreductase [Amycolatopsis antarctica]|uniref:Isoquinoline 1-oxidoreductase n=1 Tax=Amycolatopsis antarctica TaxID=1854586 RepID=A0A263CZ13_9PSEU|nr:molybdopterin cofactor-binding domain-containing protein [Amycolatopsis antarctica]OZM71138.1 isoquinoline 1-oxidoreductase [Amycolatopsis antarctica]